MSTGQVRLKAWAEALKAERNPLGDSLADYAEAWAADLAARPEVGEFDALAAAVKRYDEAIHSCGNDPEKMASFCTAEGDDLDVLYFAMVNLANRAGQPLPQHGSESK